MLSEVINRLRDLRGWTQRQFALIWASVMGAGFQLHNPWLPLLAALCSGISWYLEARYAAKSHALRRRYLEVTAVLNETPGAPPVTAPLSMTAAVQPGDFRAALFSPSMTALYGFAMGMGLIFWAVRLFSPA